MDLLLHTHRRWLRERFLLVDMGGFTSAHTQKMAWRAVPVSGHEWIYFFTQFDAGERMHPLAAIFLISILYFLKRLGPLHLSVLS